MRKASPHHKAPTTPTVNVAMIRPSAADGEERARDFFATKIGAPSPKTGTMRKVAGNGPRGGFPHEPNVWWQ